MRQTIIVIYLPDSKNCKTCERVLSVLERVGEEVAGNGITLVRVNDKKAAKTHGIRNFPALSLFKMGEALHYEGDLLDAEGILDFLSSSDALDVPGQVRIYFKNIFIKSTINLDRRCDSSSAGDVSAGAELSGGVLL